MKTSLILAITLLSTCCFAQSKRAIEEYGNTFTIADADLLLERDQQYKVIFDIAKTPESKERLNSYINTVARFINMHVDQGISLDNLEIVVVIHGAAVKDYTKPAFYEKNYDVANPNVGLIKSLETAGIKTYICGQSMSYRGYKRSDLVEEALVSISAMTALVKFQSEGYQLINFN